MNPNRTANRKAMCRTNVVGMAVVLSLSQACLLQRDEGELSIKFDNLDPAVASLHIDISSQGSSETVVVDVAKIEGNRYSLSGILAGDHKMAIEGHGDGGRVQQRSAAAGSATSFEVKAGKTTELTVLMATIVYEVCTSGHSRCDDAAGRPFVSRCVADTYWDIDEICANDEICAGAACISNAVDGGSTDTQSADSSIPDAGAVDSVVSGDATGADAATRPDVTFSDVVIPDVVVLDAVTVDGLAADTTGSMDAGAADAVVDGMLLDTAQPDTAQPDAQQYDTARQDSAVADTTQFDATTPDITVIPDGAVAEDAAIFVADFWVGEDDGTGYGKPTLEEALAAAGVMVDAGHGAQSVMVNGGDHGSGIITIPSGVSVYGGYANDYTAQNPLLYLTVINAKVQFSNTSETTCVLQDVHISDLNSGSPSLQLGTPQQGNTDYLIHRVQVTSSEAIAVQSTLVDSVHIAEVNIISGGAGIGITNATDIVLLESSVQSRTNALQVTNTDNLTGDRLVLGSSDYNGISANNVQNTDLEALSISAGRDAISMGSGQTFTLRRSWLGAKQYALHTSSTDSVTITDSLLHSDNSLTEAFGSVRIGGADLRVLTSNLIVANNDLAIDDGTWASTHTPVTVAVNNIFHRITQGDCIDDFWFNSDVLFSNWFVNCVDVVDNSQDGQPSNSGGITEASDNVAKFSGQLSLYYADWDGPDDRVYTVDDNNMTVVSTDQSFLREGHSHMGNDCGGIVCSQPEDLFSRPRTCTGAAACVTIGPVEKD